MPSLAPSSLVRDDDKDEQKQGTEGGYEPHCFARGREGTPGLQCPGAPEDDRLRATTTREACIAFGEGFVD